MSLRERIRKFFRLAEQKGVYLTKGIWRLVSAPEISLSDLEKYYYRDPVVRSAVDFIADMVAGVGYYTTAEDERAKEIVDKFAEKVNLDELLVRIVREMLVFGDAFVERIFENNRLVNLKLLPTRTMKIKYKASGEPEKYIQEVAGKRITFTPEEIIHFRYGYLAGSSRGHGIVYSIYNYLKAKDSARQSMVKILDKYSSPRIVWRTPSPTAARQLDETLRSLEAGEDIITSGDVDFKTIAIDPRARFEYFYDFIERNIFEGLKAPLLSWLRNATEASARTMLEAVDRHVSGIQRYIKRKVEAEIFRPLVEAEGLTEVPRLNWGIPRSKLEELTLRDIAELAEKGVIDYSTARDWLAKLGFPIETKPKREEAREQVSTFKPQWFETPQDVYLQLQDPSEVDTTTIRWRTLDAERGIEVMTARLKGRAGRFVVQIYFNKAKYNWTLALAKRWYRENFPHIWEKIQEIGHGQGYVVYKL